MPANARSHAVLTTESKVSDYADEQTIFPAPVRETETETRPGQHSLRNSAWWASLYVPTGR